jgi:hypothetical protein
MSQQKAKQPEYGSELKLGRCAACWQVGLPNANITGFCF